MDGVSLKCLGVEQSQLAMGGSVRGLVRDIPCSTEDEMGTKACRVFLADDDG
jgi:hypothetical protein